MCFFQEHESGAGKQGGLAGRDCPSAISFRDNAGAAKDRAMPEKSKIWTKAARRPIVADSYALGLASTINNMLVEPIGILPCRAGDQMRVFAIGIHPFVKAKLKPGTPAKLFSTAMHRYVRGASYLLALAQPGAMRHDIDGNPVEPVSEADRVRAQFAYLALRERLKQLRFANGKKKHAPGDEAGTQPPADPLSHIGP